MEIDLDVKRLVGDSTYVIERVVDGEVAWRGIRRFQSYPGQGWKVDQTGRGDWEPLGSLEQRGLRVVGHVVNHFKCQRAQRTRAELDAVVE